MSTGDDRSSKDSVVEWENGSLGTVVDSAEGEGCAWYVGGTGAFLLLEVGEFPGDGIANGLGEAMVSTHAVELPRPWTMVFAAVQGICTNWIQYC